MKVYGKERTKSARQIGRWLGHFRDIDKAVLRLEDPFEWHQVQSFGIPWEASSFLLEMWAWAREHQLGADVMLPTPTIRQARWWWWVHQAAPDITDPLDVYLISQAAVVREISHDALLAPMDLEDLQAWLAYKPWSGWPESTESLERYQAAVQAGRIPPLRNFLLTQDNAERIRQLKQTEFHLKRSQAEIDIAVYLLITMDSSKHPDYPGLLPSQAMERLRQDMGDMEYLRKHGYLPETTEQGGLQ